MLRPGARIMAGDRPQPFVGDRPTMEPKIFQLRRETATASRVERLQGWPSFWELIMNASDCGRSRAQPYQDWSNREWMELARVQ